jgi:hypothetical protein
MFLLWVTLARLVARAELPCRDRQSKNVLSPARSDSQQARVVDPRSSRRQSLAASVSCSDRLLSLASLCA